MSSRNPAVELPMIALPSYPGETEDDCEARIQLLETWLTETECMLCAALDTAPVWMEC